MNANTKSIADRLYDEGLLECPSDGLVDPHVVFDIQGATRRVATYTYRTKDTLLLTRHDTSREEHSR